METVILAGGLATRMYPITEEIPKALIPINNKPFIEYQLIKLREQNLTDIIIAIGYKGELIEKFVKDGSKWGVKVRYSDEGSNLLGTGGAIKKICREKKINDSFFVLYGDSYLPISFIDIQKYFTNQKLKILMTVFKNKNRFDSSNCVVSNDKVIRYEKNLNPLPNEMQWIDYGLMILNKEKILENIPDNKKEDLSLFLSKQCLLGNVSAYEVNDRFYEIGSKQGLQDFKNHLNEKIV